MTLGAVHRSIRCMKNHPKRKAPAGKPAHITSLSVAYEAYAGNIEVNGRLVTFWKKGGDWTLMESGIPLFTFKAKTPLKAATRAVEWLLENPLHE